METPEKKKPEEPQDREKLKDIRNVEQPDQGTNNSDEDQQPKESAGEKFLRELRAAPYLNDRVGQVFICRYSKPKKR